MGASRWEEIEQRLENIEVWVIQGFSEKEIAMMLNISYASFRNYKKAYLALFETLQKGKIKKQEADVKVEQALYMKACGYNYTEQKEVKCKDVYYDEEGRQCSQERIEVVEIQKHVQGDVAAQKFWLTNKKKKEWQDNPHKVSNDKKLLALKEKEAERNEVF